MQIRYKVKESEDISTFTIGTFVPIFYDEKIYYFAKIVNINSEEVILDIEDGVLSSLKNDYNRKLINGIFENKDKM